MKRALWSLLLGTVVTFALFGFMAKLISGGAKRAALMEPIVPTIIITMELKDSEPTLKYRAKLPPPEPLISPQRPEIEVPAVQVDSPELAQIEFSQLDFGGLALGGMGSLEAETHYQGDANATPLVRIEPRYPIAAARDRIQGWVQLGFTITESGSVDEIRVVASEPVDVFDQAAISALQKWRYQPKRIGGKAVRQPGKVVQLDFRLTRSR
ncbi:energy transducer TonB [Paraferrimonas sedimenticola]|uniref:Protein TonB n=1 Tax=Paraferrimonas sedimenticola TaxID=375674 RepID=A0AA37W0U2_9GAMM|nr:energy transducer TonB [Paraferrimonas sedimenticola]GLP95547.1 protein TonB [Paraferrimonas sedimenticola]